jgi:hypothetical protein
MSELKPGERESQFSKDYRQDREREAVSECEHVWKTRGGDWDNPKAENVECIKCGVPGERYANGEVFWPAT